MARLTKAQRLKHQRELDQQREAHQDAVADAAKYHELAEALWDLISNRVESEVDQMIDEKLDAIEIHRGL